MRTRAGFPKAFQRPTLAAFEALLDEMFDLGVLGRAALSGSQRSAYCLKSRRVASMLGAPADINTALLELEHEPPPVAYDRSVHRRPYDTTGQPSSGAHDRAYSPLTDLQIETLLRPGLPAVRLVASLDMLGLDRVGIALRRIAATSRLPGACHGDAEIPVEVVIAEKPRFPGRTKAKHSAGGGSRTPRHAALAKPLTGRARSALISCSHIY